MLYVNTKQTKEPNKNTALLVIWPFYCINPGWELTTAAPLPVCMPPSHGTLIGVPGLLWVYGVVPWRAAKSSRVWTTRKSSPPTLREKKERRSSDVYDETRCLAGSNQS